MEAIRAARALGPGDGAFFVAGKAEGSPSSPARRAPASASELKLIDKDRFRFCWIVDFPIYEWNEEEKKVDFAHNPFSMPQGGLEALQTARTR
jgi:aspartyl-tRNA synthetase